MATVDSLDIQISAEVKKANASIDLLVKRLDRLSASLSGVNARGLATLGSGVNKLSNAMNNFSKNTKISDFTKLTSSLKKLNDINVTSINAVSPAIERIAKSMDSIGSLNFGNNSKQVASMVKSLGSLNKINSTSIKNATDAIGKIAGAMNGIKSMNFGDNSTKISELARSISNLGGKSATTAISNIPKLADSMKKFMQTLSTAPKVSQNLIDMTNAMAKFARTGSSGGRAAVSLGSNISNMAKKLMSAPKSINMFNKSITTSVFSMNKLKGSISSFLGMFGGIYAVFNGLKESVNISSDLTEVQNVIDTAFGKYKNTIEKFSNTSIQDFGMSELTAKTIAGRFQAMGSAMGFAQKDMAKMSVSLTGLAGDMASFYNVSQEEMGKSLQSIFTGETEPMRKYGVDLTNATIRQWAMKRGIDANVNSMTQMEKTMLRYQYVMAQTGAAQGDFLRTQDTWANQIRLLAENFKVLGGIVGGVIINAFKPFIKSLNVVMEQVNSFAKIISDALGKIFGWTYEEGGGSVNPADDMASSMGDLSDATENATKKQKELNRQLGKFDELNNYSKPSDSSGDNGGSANLGITSSDGGSGGKWKQGKSMIKSFESEIDTLYKLGKKIGDTLKGAMDSINWDSIYKKAENFGTGLATFLNGLISPELFSSLGTTVANSLTTALKGLNSFGKTFDWSEFGKSISSSINSFFKDFDWKLSANTFNTFANGILDSIIESIDEINWKKIRESIVELINEIDFSKTGWKLGKLVSSISNALYTLVSDKKSWEDLGDNLAKGINNFFRGNDWKKTGKAIGGSIKGILDALITAMESIDWNKVGRSIGEFISNIEFSNIVWKLGELAKSIVSGIGKALLGSFSKAPIETAIVTILSGLKFSGKLNATTFSNLATNIVSSIGDSIGTESNISSLGSKIGTFLDSGIGKSVSKLAKGAGIALVVSEFLRLLQDGLNENRDSLFKDTTLGKSVSDAEESVKKLKNATKSLKESLDDVNGTDFNFTEEGIQLDNLAQKYKTLAEKESLSAGEKKRLKDYASKLIETIPSLNKLINESTGEYKGEWKEIQKVIESKKQEYILMAKEEKLKELAVKIADAEEKQASAMAKKKKAQKEYNELVAKIAKEVEKAEKNGQDGASIINSYGYSLGKLEDAIELADKELEESNKTVEKANKEYDKLAKSTENTRKSTEKNTKTLKEHKKELKESYDTLSKMSDKDLKINVKSKDAKEKIEEIDNSIKSLEDKKKEIKLTGSNEDAKGKIAKINEDIDDLMAKKTTISILASDTDAETKLIAIEERRKELNNKEAIIKAKANTKDAKDKLKEIDDERKELNKKEIKIKASADSDDLEDKIEAIDLEIDSLNEKKLELTAKAKTKKVKEKLESVKKEIDKLIGAKHEIKLKLGVETTTQFEKVKKTAEKYKKSNPEMYAAMQQYANSVKANGGIFKNGKWSEITKYAVGGFPNQGQMFIAREAGPELVGTIGGSTAVVNNQQIVASVSEGVAKAVASVIAPMISYNSQGGDVVVQIDGQTVAKAVRKQNTDFRRRTGRGMFD